MIPVLLMPASQTPPGVPACQSDLMLNLVCSARPLVSTFMKLSYMAGTMSEKHTSCQLPYARESPELAPGLGFALTCCMTPG